MQRKHLDELRRAWTILTSDPSRAALRCNGTVMRPSKFREYAMGAGYRDVEILPMEHDFLAFVQTHSLTQATPPV